METNKQKLDKLRQWARDNYTPGVLDEDAMKMGFHEVIIEEWKDMEMTRGAVSSFIESYKSMLIRIEHVTNALPNADLDDLLDLAGPEMARGLSACQGNLHAINDILDQMVEAGTLEMKEAPEVKPFQAPPPRIPMPGETWDERNHGGSE